MEILDTLPIVRKAGESKIVLYRGDLTDLPAETQIDLLIVSAIQGKYRPTRGTLIGALEQKGISVGKLAEDKELNLLDNFHCWLSKEIKAEVAGVKYKRILCFEPGKNSKPPELVGELFRALIAVVEGGYGIKSVAMPVVSTGFMGVPKLEMFEPLLDAAAHWMALGLSVDTLMIFERDPVKAAMLQGAFAILKRKYSNPDLLPGNTPAPANPLKPEPHSYTYDFFISYSWKNKNEVDFLIKELRSSQPGIRLFLDREELKAGVAWQSAIYQALEDCPKTVAIFSQDYLKSPMCQEEYHITRLREKDLGIKILIPVFLYDTKLPAHMKLTQYIDCREGDTKKLKAASKDILAILDNIKSATPTSNIHERLPVRFYREQEKHPTHGLLSEILKWDNASLEQNHDFIQWLFPSMKPSNAVAGSPVLSDNDIAIFNNEPLLRDQLLKSFKRMLRFYGYHYQVQGTEVVITPAADWNERKCVWLHPFNHNFHRITRILASLKRLGLQPQSKAFFQALNRLYQGEGRDSISEYTLTKWQDAANR